MQSCMMSLLQGLVAKLGDSSLSADKVVPCIAMLIVGKDYS